MLYTSRRSGIPEGHNALHVRVEARRARGLGLLDLTCTNPTTLGLSLPLPVLHGLLGGTALSPYDPASLGEFAAREAVAHYLSKRGPEVAAQNVMLTASSSEAYGYLFKLLCDPGDEVLVPTPSYPLLDMLAQLESVRIVPYPLAFDDSFHLDIAALSARRGPRTRAIVCVHPNNPTGSFHTRDELKALAQLGLPIISDEVFADHRLWPARDAARSVAEAAPSALVFRLGGLSKSLLLPQLKLAWTALHGPAEAVERARALLEHIADTYLSPSTPVQRITPALLAHAPALQAGVRARVMANAGGLREALRGSAASLLPLEGGSMGIVRMPALGRDEDLAMALLDEQGVLVQPGFLYDLHQFTAFVVSLWTDPGTMEAGVRRLRRFVDRLTQG
jgi:aspartate/methionine/tyrosine aminotransferase